MALLARAPRQRRRLWYSVPGADAQLVAVTLMISECLRVSLLNSHRFPFVINEYLEGDTGRQTGVFISLKLASIVCAIHWGVCRPRVYLLPSASYIWQLGRYCKEELSLHHQFMDVCYRVDRGAFILLCGPKSNTVLSLAAHPAAAVARGAP